MHVLRELADTKLAQRIADFLVSKFPTDLTAQDLLPRIRLLVRRARDYGLQSDQAVATYVTTAWLLGVDFDHDFPFAQQVLLSKRPELAKAEQLRAWAIDVLHHAVRGMAL
jgi:hypothetical protein